MQSIVFIKESHSFQARSLTGLWVKGKTLGTLSPTTLAAPLPELAKAVDAVRAAQEDCPCCNILGIHRRESGIRPAG